MERTAQCHCGQLKAVTAGAPERVYVCHCKSCQRRTGAVVHSGSQLAEKPGSYRGRAQNLRRDRRSRVQNPFPFLPELRVERVLGRRSRGPDHITEIAVGCFADPDFPAPIYSSYEDAMHPWLGVATAKEHFPGPRPANLPIDNPR